MTAKSNLVWNCPVCGQLTSQRTWEQHGKEMYEAEQQELYDEFAREAFYPSPEAIAADIARGGVGV